MILTLGTTPVLQRTLQFERLVIDAVNRCSEISQYASGKSINAARVLHTMGKEVLTSGFLGGDTGKLVRLDLDHAKIPHDFVEVAASTRICTTLVDRSNGTATEIVEEPGAVEAKAYTRVLREYDANLWRAKAAVLSGSLPPGAPVGFYADCVAAAVREEVPVVLDARGEALKAALPYGPFVVKPNRLELGETVGVEITDEGVLRVAINKLTEMGARWVVVTLGSEGAVASDGSTFWKISTPQVKAVSAVGSGDAFAAGLAAGISAGEDVPTAASLAAACGAANALTAEAGHLHMDDVRRLQESVRVRAI